jgi:ATP-binding cassette subfamily B protein
MEGTLKERTRLGTGFPVFRQMDQMDCGPTCLRMVARHYGRTYTLETLRERCALTRQGVSLLGIAYAAESIGLRTLRVKTGWEQLAGGAPLPAIAHWEQNHFVVVYRVTPTHVHVADPGQGRVVMTREEWMRGWASTEEEGRPLGVLLLLEPTPEFLEREGDPRGSTSQLRFLAGYLRGHGRLFGQVGLAMLVASLLQLVFPFLTQAVVDHGIGNRDLGFVQLVLVAQLALFAGRTSVEFIRNRILFHVGSRVYLALSSDFLLKLMRLPVSFFDTRMVGDILQRVQDHGRIQQFLTTTTLNVLFSAVTLVVFGAVMAVYSPLIVSVFLVGSAVYLAYVLLFLKPRRSLDHQRFAEFSRSQSALVELVSAMPEVKLANAEQAKRWQWERIQARLFRLNLRGLGIEQMQDGGATCINELKNILITFLAVRLVIDGQLTVGMLLSVQYILGQLNQPLSQVVAFVQSGQDARISLERLAQIHAHPDEEEPGATVGALPPDRSIRLRNVGFTYGGPLAEPVLRDVSLDIPEGKVTAVVGTSGSGKTTLLKLLLKFHDPTEGEITVGGTRLGALSNRVWRDSCGVVMQDGQLFSDSIAGNVAMGAERTDPRRLQEAVRVANVHDFVEHLPLAYNTRVGREGIGMSAGQKQRLLIARAVYKDPEYLLFDEATSALDANNERVIMQNLQAFFRGRTVVVIAHRLSTVRNADQIVVLDGGRVVERGTHDELTAARGPYFELVKNQLELGV